MLKGPTHSVPTSSLSLRSLEGALEGQPSVSPQPWQDDRYDALHWLAISADRRANGSRANGSTRDTSRSDRATRSETVENIRRELIAEQKSVDIIRKVGDEVKKRHTISGTAKHAIKETGSLAAYLGKETLGDVGAILALITAGIFAPVVGTMAMLVAGLKGKKRRQKEAADEFAQKLCDAIAEIDDRLTLKQFKLVFEAEYDGILDIFDQYASRAIGTVAAKIQQRKRALCAKR